MGSRQQTPRRASLRQFGKIVFGDNFPGALSRPSRRRSQQSAASGASSHLSTAGSLILREFSSTGSVGESDQASCIMAKVYRVPHHVLKRGFARLEMRFSPDSHGELRASLILTTLRIFDEYFHTGRTRAERHWIVDRLETSMHDFTKKKWNADELLNAFGVKMNMCERIYFTVDVSGTSNLLSRFVSGFMVITIIISIAIWMAGTIPRYTVVQCPNCEPEPLQWMQVVDEVCVIIFTTEFLIRMLTAPFARAKLLQARFLLKMLFDRDIKAEEKEHLDSEHDEEESEDVEIEKERFSWISNWLSFWRQPNAIVDLFTVLPYWVEVVFATSADSNFIWLRLFRLLRVSRIFKLLQLVNSDLWQLSDAQHLLYNVMIQAAPAFAITLALLGFALLVFSSLMYEAERGNWYPVSVLDGASNATEFVNFSQVINLPAVQHEARRAGGVFLRKLPNGYLDMTPFTSILVCSWWTLATITTVGYGDHIPVSIPGQMVGAVAILYGTILLGLPIGIIGSQFSNEFGRMVASGRSRDHGGRGPERRTSVGNQKLPVPSGAGPDAAGGSAGTKTPRKSFVGQQVVSTIKKVMQRESKKNWEAEQMQADNAKKLQQLPLNAKQKEQLIYSKYSFEDLLKMHGENIGITVETQQFWMEALWVCQFQAGPALDRLSASVLTFLSDAEKRRGPGHVQPLRLAWLDLCLACCSVSEKLSRPSFRAYASDLRAGSEDSVTDGVQEGSDSENVDRPKERDSQLSWRALSSMDSIDAHRKHITAL